MNALALINKLAASSPPATSSAAILNHSIQRTSSTSSSNSTVTTTAAASSSATKKNGTCDNNATTQLMSTLAAIASPPKNRKQLSPKSTIAKDSNDCTSSITNGTASNNVGDNSSDAAKLLASLLALGTNKQSLANVSSDNSTTITSTTVTSTTGNSHRGSETKPNANDNIMKQNQRRNCNSTNQHAQNLRDLEKWHDDAGSQLDESFFCELEDNPNNSKGWSADEMFKYNEKMHNITTNYNERTHAKNYTTPLPKLHTKTTLRLASQLAKEIEDKVAAEGRITPESSDDDELFEKKRMQRLQLKQRGQLSQLLKAHQRHSQQQKQQKPQQQDNFYNNINSGGKVMKSSEKFMNSTKTITSPTLNPRDTIKPVTSSSRNILRACLT